MLTAIVLTQNEEINIASCIKSVSFCDELLVVDDDSKDQTIKLAQQLGAKTIAHSLNGDFAAQRNFAMELARGEWVLFIDADEIVSPELQNEIISFTKPIGIDPQPTTHTSQPTSYFIRRQDHFWGQPVTHGEVDTASTRGFIRLMKKGSGKWEGAVHEVFVPTGDSEALHGFIEHYPHEDISSFLASVNRYSTIRAAELIAQGHRVSIAELMLYPFGKFIYTYFLKKGFADGPPGFVYSFMMSFHSFLVRAKVLTMNKL